MKKLCLIILTFLLIGSCQETIDPEINVLQSLLVVDGWIYNTPGPHTVKVSRSVAFENPQNFIPIRNASVIIRNGNQDIELLREISLGTYVTDQDFMGEVGKSYQVEITLSTGEVYLSEFEPLLDVPEIDTLTLEPDFLGDTDPLFDPFSYFPVAFVKEFEEKGNFYRWKLAKDDVFFNEPQDIILQTDRFVNGNLFKNEFKEYQFFDGDTATVRLESLTQQAYDFLRFFRRQTTDLGTSTGTNPGTLKGNINNANDENEIVLGYFGASAVSSAREAVPN